MKNYVDADPFIFARRYTRVDIARAAAGQQSIHCGGVRGSRREAHADETRQTGGQDECEARAGRSNGFWVLIWST
ncbi:MAG: hypothetical protein WCK07_11185 [Betaproteobacteria bacterium]